MKLITKIFILFLFLGCKAPKAVVKLTPNKKTETKTELRGVWVASVLNIDWPKSTDLSLVELKSSYINILDFYQDLHFNAVFVQIRTAGDALYPSAFAPWSRFISGKEGRALSEDILPWLIEETHARGMEFHAWMNPYRATTSLDTTILSDDHAFNQHRDWMIKYGNKYYFNPALNDVQDHLLNVINEVTNTYDVDGIHFDDYFYPYKIKDEVFADSLQFSKRINKLETLADWRRNNINNFISSCYTLIKMEKPHVQFGVSPFGVWRNKSSDPMGSDTRAGQTVYDDLYADTRTWIQNGWMDYIAPQLYWSMDYPAASHRKLVDWWTEEVVRLPLYIGLGAYKVENNADTTWNDLNELLRQIDYGRHNQVDGFIVFSAKSIMKKPKVASLLKQKVFQQVALTPSQAPWAQSKLTCGNEVTKKGKFLHLKIERIFRKASHLAISYTIPKGFLRKEKTIEIMVPVRDGKVEVDLHRKAQTISFAGVNSMKIKTKENAIKLTK